MHTTLASTRSAAQFAISASTIGTSSCAMWTSVRRLTLQYVSALLPLHAHAATHSLMLELWRYSVLLPRRAEAA